MDMKPWDIRWWILVEALPGQGFIGMDAMKRFAMHPAFEGLPFILETPNDDEGYIHEITTVKSWFNL
jgi:endonuclease IV